MLVDFLQALAACEALAKRKSGHGSLGDRHPKLSVQESKSDIVSLLHCQLLERQNASRAPALNRKLSYKGCDHVAGKAEKRCRLRVSDDGVPAYEACKETCGSC